MANNYFVDKTRKLLEEILVSHKINCDIIKFEDWNELEFLKEKVETDDNMIIILSRKNFISYHQAMERIRHI